MGDGTTDTAFGSLVDRVTRGDPGAARQALQRLLEYWEAHDPDLDPLLDELVDAAKSGSDTALEVVLTAIHQLGLARPAIVRLIIEPATVDEVAQATLVKVEANLSKFEGRSKFRTWLHSVARNEALMRLRRNSGRPVADIDELEDAAPAGRRMSSVIASRTTVRDALEALPEPYRETMLLRVDEDLEYDEIARQLDVPVGTVRSRLAKARALLAQALALE